MPTNKCKHPGGAVITLFGQEVDPCRYVEVETHTNVTVRVLRCKICGHEEIEWERTDETVSTYEKEEF